MLDIIIITLAIVSSVYQLVASYGIIYYKIKCKNSELHMVTNLWFDYIPHLFLIYSLLFLIYSIKFSDTFVLLTVICLTILISNIQILVYNKKYITLISFPYHKENYNSIIEKDKIIYVENEKRKKFITNLTKAKINKITQTLSEGYYAQENMDNDLPNRMHDDKGM